MTSMNDTIDSLEVAIAQSTNTLSYISKVEEALLDQMDLLRQMQQALDVSRRTVEAQQDRLEDLLEDRRHQRQMTLEAAYQAVFEEPDFDDVWEHDEQRLGEQLQYRVEQSSS